MSIRLGILTLLFFGFSFTTYASVPTVGGINIFQQHPDDTGKQIAWCDDYTPSGTTTVHYPIEWTDDNGYKYWEYEDLNGDNDFPFDHSDKCNNQSVYFQTPRGIPDDSQGEYWFWFITGSDPIDTNVVNSDFIWRDATGASEICGPSPYDYKEIHEDYGLGGVNYDVIGFRCALQQDTPATNGAGGWIESLNDALGAGNLQLYYMTYTAASSTSELLQIDTSTDLQAFLDDVNNTEWQGESGGLPSSNSNWIVLTEPDNGDSTSYTVNLTGYLNLYGVSTGTKSYTISFVSQTGVDYSDMFIYGTTSEYSEYRFDHTVTFALDDIVFVKAYLYDDPAWNAVNLVDISPEYQWNVSSDGNPTGAVDLGIYRTGTTTFCGTSAGAFDFAWGTCMALRLLFVPNETSLNYIASQISTATGTIPFSYMYDVGNYFDTFFGVTTTAFSVTFSSSTPVFAGYTLIDTDDLSSNSNFQSVRDVLGYMFILLIPLYAYRRVKSLARSL